MKIYIGLNVNDLYSLCEFLNRNLLYDKFTVNVLKEKIFDDPLFDKSLIFSLKEKKQFVGFIHGVKGEYKGIKTGWIKLLAVEYGYNSTEATKLLKKLEQRFISLNDKISQIRVMDSVPSYYQPGVDPRYTDAIVFFMKNGYEKDSENIHLETNLKDINFRIINLIEKNLKKKKIVVERASKEKHYTKLKQFIEQVFPLWNYEVDLSFKYLPERIFVAVDTYNNKIVGFSCYEVTSPTWFGPIGTHPEYRKLGIGKLLLLKCLLEQKKFNRKIVTIPWVPISALSFYLSGCNAKISRIFWTLRKNLN